MADVLKLDACLFFTLLNESLRINAQEKLEEINIELLPHLKKHSASEIINGYKKQLTDYSDLKVNDNFDNLHKLKELL